MEAAATLRRYQILFFGFDWDLKPEINIHTLHRTEHLVAIYFKGRITIFFFPPESGGRGGVVEVSVVWISSSENTDVKTYPSVG